jgi:hypothetical protein
LDFVENVPMTTFRYDFALEKLVLQQYKSLAEASASPTGSASDQDQLQVRLVVFSRDFSVCG